MIATDRFTLDTNVLVYAIDLDAGIRHAVAVTILDAATELPCVLTLQSLAEFFRATTRKRLVPLADAAGQVRDWLALFPTAGYGERAISAALSAAEAGRFAFFDALMLATAEAAGCKLILSEDMHDGARFGDLRVRNPFAAQGLVPDIAEMLGRG